MRGRGVLAALVGLLTTGGCARDAVESGGHRHYPGDTLVSVNGVPEWPDTADLVLELRIGQAYGDERYYFEQVSALALTRQGNLLVYDAGFQSIREYTPGGVHVRTFGRKGGGPGEFGYVEGIAALADGRIVARDARNIRINVYDSDGQSVDHWTRPVGRPTWGQFALRADHEGGVFAGINPSMPADGGDLAWPRPTYVHLDRDGAVTDTLFVPESLLRDCPTRSNAKYRSGFYEDVRERYVPKVKWSLDPVRGLIVGCPSEYVIHVVGFDGRVRRITRPGAPFVGVSRAERENYTARWTYQKHWSRIDPSFVWDHPLPDRKPAFQHLLVGEDGRLWVWRPVSSREVADERSQRFPTRWVEPNGAFDVFDEAGRFLGVVRVPDDMPFQPNPLTTDPVMKGDTVWAVTLDEDDVQFVTRFRVVHGNSRAAR